LFEFLRKFEFSLLSTLAVVKIEVEFRFSHGFSHLNSSFSSVKSPLSDGHILMYNRGSCSCRFRFKFISRELIIWELTSTFSIRQQVFVHLEVMGFRLTTLTCARIIKILLPQYSRSVDLYRPRLEETQSAGWIQR
jgi:hypothetical protein